MSFGSTTSRPRLRARLALVLRYPSGLAKPLHAELKKLFEISGVWASATVTRPSGNFDKSSGALSRGLMSTFAGS